MKMREFPKHLNAKYKDKFSELNYNRMKCYIRKNLYEHLINNEEKDYFSLDDVGGRYRLKMEIVQKIVKDLIPELEQLGWTCKLSFGETGLFIYSGDKPVNCWEE